jgi:hypothetical protein
VARPGGKFSPQDFFTLCTRISNAAQRGDFATSTGQAASRAGLDWYVVWRRACATPAGITTIPTMAWMVGLVEDDESEQHCGHG